jgi:hypothetical protein
MWVGGARKDIIKEVKRASSILCETQISKPAAGRVLRSGIGTAGPTGI